MDIIKRNIGLTIFSVLALVALIVLFVITRGHAARAKAFEDKVEAQRDFIEKVSRGKVEVTEENLETVESNLALSTQKLDQLQSELSGRAQITVPFYSGVECKNILRRDTIMMRERLARQQIEVDPQAGAFSFRSILQEDTLPDEEREVPVIMKQLEIVKEIVRLIGMSNKGNLQVMAINRDEGLRIGKRDLYQVMPFTVTLTGDLESIRDFTTRLQRDANYLFMIKYSTLKATDPVDALVGSRGTVMPGATPSPGAPVPGMEFPGYGTMPPSVPPTRAPRTADTASAGAAEDESAPVSSRESRLLVFDDLVQTEIRFDFVEFRNPAEEN